MVGLATEGNGITVEDEIPKFIEEANTEKKNRQHWKNSQSQFTDESEITRFPPNRHYSNMPDNLIMIKPPIRVPTYEQYHRTYCLLGSAQYVE